jgi:hypothetical protein
MAVYVENPREIFLRIRGGYSMRHSRGIVLTVLVLALTLASTGGLVRSAASGQQAADQPMVQHAASAKYNTFPNTPTV